MLSLTDNGEMENGDFKITINSLCLEQDCSPVGNYGMGNFNIHLFIYLFELDRGFCSVTVVIIIIIINITPNSELQNLS